MSGNIYSDIDVKNNNADIGVIPNRSHYVLDEEKDSPLGIDTFQWIQAFFDATVLTLSPELAVWDGIQVDVNGNPIVSVVRFAFSGDRILFKSKQIMSSGTDISGNTISSLTIGATAATDFSAVIVYGGAR